MAKDVDDDKGEDEDADSGSDSDSESDPEWKHVNEALARLINEGVKVVWVGPERMARLIEGGVEAVREEGGKGVGSWRSGGRFV